MGKLHCGCSSKAKLTRRTWPSCYPELHLDLASPPLTLARVLTSTLQADDQLSGKGSETYLALQVIPGFLVAFVDLQLYRFDLLGMSRRLAPSILPTKHLDIMGKEEGMGGWLSRLQQDLGEVREQLLQEALQVAEASESHSHVSAFPAITISEDRPTDLASPPSPFR